MTFRPAAYSHRDFGLLLLGVPALGLLPEPAPAQSAGLELDARFAERFRRRYRIGDAVALRVRVNQDAQVWILNIDAWNRVTVLRPNRFAPSAHLAANRWHLFPAPGSTFALRATAPTGRNELRILASPGRRPHPLSQLLRQGDDGFERIEGDKPPLESVLAQQQHQDRSFLAEQRLGLRVIA